MSEHVGRSRIEAYFSGLASLLSPRGRLLNHAISSVGGSKLGPRTFIGRYVFPDGELLDVGDTVLAMGRQRRARVWRLYMAASALGFEDGGLAIHQVLGIAADGDGTSGMPLTRDRWATGSA